MLWLLTEISFKKEEKDLLSKLVEKIVNSVNGGNIRCDVNDQYICIIVKWMKENYDCRVKEWWPMKNGNLIVKLEGDAGVDDQDNAKSIN